MYFAAFLFWVTGIVALIISLMTSPDEEYKVRSTMGPKYFWSCISKKFPKTIFMKQILCKTLNIILEAFGNAKTHFNDNSSWWVNLEICETRISSSSKFVPQKNLSSIFKLNPKRFRNFKYFQDICLHYNVCWPVHNWAKIFWSYTWGLL